MATIAYRVARQGEQWSIAREGHEEDMTYVTQEAAFEAAAGEAGGDLRSGHAIVIQVQPATDPSGARDLGGAPVGSEGFHI